MTDERNPYEVDMQVVVEFINREGIPAYVEHTGGNCATIYAGVPYKVIVDCTCPRTETLQQHEPYCPVPHGGETRYPAVAGPGWFAGSFTKPRASLYEFGVGPDDDGEGGYVDFASIGALEVPDIAKVVLAQVHKTEVARTNGFALSCLSTDEIEALGFDGTGRSEPTDMRKEKMRTRVGMDAHNAMNKRLAELGVPHQERMPYNEEASRRALFDYDYPPITERRGDPAP